MKKFLAVFFYIIFFFLHSSVYAASDFTTSFDITYTIKENGETHIVFRGSLQNNTENFYAQSYSMQVGFTDLLNIRASDNEGTIVPQVDKLANSTKITIPFNKHAVGLNSSNYFTFSFDTSSIAKHIGSIWEVNIPGLANQADFRNFTTHLIVPKSFGQPIYRKPDIPGSSLNFDKSVLGSSGISLGFGDKQIYAFKLIYHIKNDHSFPVRTEIALPPTTNYQDSFIESISPKPENVIKDTDGNWLAEYTLTPSQTRNPVVKGTVFISLTPKSELLTTIDRKQFLKEDLYWQVTNPQIKKLADDLKTPKAIFDYVVHHLSYDFTRVAGKQERLGALTVINNPLSAVCLEFTDLFVAIARAAGIPAREIDGYAYTENPQERPLSLANDILHAWPEYYDDTKQAWVMVDPTWENTTKGIDYFTTLDFDHIVFAIKGISSSYPVPAGGYKLSENATGKDVFVSFAPDAIESKPLSQANFIISDIQASGVSITGSIIVKNIGEGITETTTAQVTTAVLTPQTQSIAIPPVPPFGFQTIPVTFDKTPFLTNRHGTITIQIAGNTLVKYVSVFPFFFQKKYIIGGIIFVILGIIISSITTRTRRISSS